jgi:hypothetical protein
MGASESKLVFKQGIFRLSEERNIPANDPYWTGVSSPGGVMANGLTLAVLGIT